MLIVAERWRVTCRFDLAVRYPIANPAVISSINDEIEKCEQTFHLSIPFFAPSTPMPRLTATRRYTSLTTAGIITCISVVGDRPMVISSEQASRTFLPPKCCVVLHD
jgi:hypothetical protein